MRIGSLFLAMMLMFASGPAAAMPERISGPEIRGMLPGNTVVGTWSSKAYQQLFRPDGTTAFKIDGAELDEGRWWVTDENYCSWWRGSGEDCYQVLRDGDEVTWRTKGLFSRSLEGALLPGDHLAPR